MTKMGSKLTDDHTRGRAVYERENFSIRRAAEVYSMTFACIPMKFQGSVRNKVSKKCGGQILFYSEREKQFIKRMIRLLEGVFPPKLRWLEKIS